MQASDLYRATVPVLTHYLEQLDRLASRLGSGDLAVDLTDRLTPDTFCAGEHFIVAQGFSLRAVFPAIGREVPALTTEAPTFHSISQRNREISDYLIGIEPTDFAHALDRTVSHQAGEARLEQNAVDYVTLFALPNFFFHLTMGYATLRKQGVAIGKSDFDGLHDYPTGFRFDD
ncbi:MAG: DUF1993 family protein [Pseudomonadota bacterium]